jgi:hypothetical protein
VLNVSVRQSLADRHSLSVRTVQNLLVFGGFSTELGANWLEFVLAGAATNSPVFGRFFDDFKLVQILNTTHLFPRMPTTFSISVEPNARAVVV